MRVQMCVVVEVQAQKTSKNRYVLSGRETDIAKVWTYKQRGAQVEKQKNRPSGDFRSDRVDFAGYISHFDKSGTVIVAISVDAIKIQAKPRKRGCLVKFFSRTRNRQLKRKQ
jgi:hypothetical protein